MRLGRCVEGRGWLIEEKEWSVASKDAGESKTLALSLGKVRASLANLRVQATRRFRDQILQAGRSDRPHHAAVVGAGIPPCDVEAIIASKDRWRLRQRREKLSKRGYVACTKVETVQKNSSVVRIIQPHQQGHERRFSGAAGSNQTDDFAGRNFKAEPIEHWAVWRVAEAHIFDAKTPLNLLPAQDKVAADQGPYGGGHVFDASECCSRVGDPTNSLAKGAHRMVKHSKVGHEENQITQGNRVGSKSYIAAYKDGTRANRHDHICKGSVFDLSGQNACHVAQALKAAG